MADYYLHKTAAHIDELLEKVEGLNNYDDTEVRGLINNKVDKVTGKGLSTNDFTDTYKTELDGLDTALNGKVDKETGKGLSTNDFTTEEKTKLAGIESGARVNVQADWNQLDSSADDYIKNKPAIPDAQIQSDWNQTNTESKDFIKNKPTIPAAQVNVDWNAESGVAQILNKPTLGSAAAKDYTTSATSGSNDLVTSGAVYTALASKADLIDGKVPSCQLPSYVDDVLEYASTAAFPVTGENGKIYIATDTNKTYRWGGSAYVEISESLALGETASTAYAGNKGKANADAIATIKDGTNIDSFAGVEAALALKANTTDQQRQDAEIGSLVDRGAKNLSSVDSIVYTGESAGWKVADISYIDSGTYKISCNIERPSGSVASVQVWCKYTDDTTEMVVSNTQAASIVSTITFSKKVTQLSIYCTSTATVKNIMICTLEDWAVSHKFVPYAPSNRELYEMILALQNAQNGG